MARKVTVEEVRAAIMVIRRFSDDEDLCQPFLKKLVWGCADVADTALEARGWRPFFEGYEGE